jgi:hypothetical protein
MKPLIYILLTVSALTIFSKSFAQKAYLLNRQLYAKVKYANFKLIPLQNDLKDIDMSDAPELLFGRYSFKQSFRFEYDIKGNLTYNEGTDYFYRKKYNLKGQLLESAAYSSVSPKKGIMSRQTYTYMNGKLMEENRYSYFTGSEFLQSTIKYTYDQIGNLIQTITKDFDYKSTTTPQYIYKSDFQYNSKQLLSEETNYTEKGTIKSTIKYIYDSKKRKQSKSYSPTYNSSGFTEYYTYNSNGNITENSKIDSQGKQISKETTLYDAKNKVLERKTYEGKTGKITETVYNYNLNSQLIKEQKTVNNKESYSIIYDLDKNQNIIRAIFYNPQNVAVLKYEINFIYYP